MSVTFLLLVHEDPAGVARLVDRLQAPGHAFVVHVDRRVDDAPFRAALKASAGVSFVADDARVCCHWAGWSLCRAMLALLATGCRAAPADWYQYLSGADYPLRPASRLEDYYRDGGMRVACWREITPTTGTPLRLRRRVFGYNFNDVRWLNKRELAMLPLPWRWPVSAAALLVKLMTYALPLRAAPPGLRVIRGSQWAALSAAQAHALQGFLGGGEGRQVAAFLAGAAAPDELLLPSLLDRLEMRDGCADVPQAGLRHATHWIDWRDTQAPAPLTAAAVVTALASGALFVRKLPPSASTDGRRLRDQVDIVLAEGPP